MTDYAKQRELIAVKRQVQDAAVRRRKILSQIQHAARDLQDDTTLKFEESGLSQMLDEFMIAEKEMRAAIELANQTATSCGVAQIKVVSLF